MSRAVRALLARGLLLREEDAADRRVQRLAMTAAGRGVHAGIVPLARALETELLAGLEATERAALHRLLDALEDRLAAMGAGPGPEELGPEELGPEGPD